MPTWIEARERMVAEQLERRGIRDARVLDAMRKVPRHLFVPLDQQSLAYTDRALPIGAGQTISQPYMVAVMTEALRPSASDRVLEIGTGSGYQAAILAELVREVITIERRAELSDVARAQLRELGYQNVSVLVGDGSRGHSAGAPYDGILVTAGAPHAPVSLIAQLADAARLVVPVGTALDQTLLILERRGDEVVESRVEGCVFVPLVGAEGWPEE